MDHGKGDATMTVTRERAKLKSELKRVKETQEQDAITKALLKNRVP